MFPNVLGILAAKKVHVTKDKDSDRYRLVVSFADVEPSWLVYAPATGDGASEDIVQRGRFWTEGDANFFAIKMDVREHRDVDAPVARLSVLDQSRARTIDRATHDAVRKDRDRLGAVVVTLRQEFAAAGARIRELEDAAARRCHHE
jgi:hypothetical protein